MCKNNNIGKQSAYCMWDDVWLSERSWDEWVPESRVLKLNDASRQKQRELQNAHMYALPSAVYH